MDNKFNAINRKLSKHLLFDALFEIKIMLINLQDSALSDRWHSIEQNYQYLIDYFLSDQNDPDRERIFMQLTAETVLLLEDVRIAFEAKNESASWLALKSSWAGLQGSTNRFDQLKDVFYRFLFMDNNDTQAIEQLKEIIQSADQQTVSMAISGITIGILQHFSLAKIITLTDVALSSFDESMQRAMTGLALIYLKYDYLLPFFPQLQERLQLLINQSDIKKYWQDIIRLLIETTLTRQTHDVMRQIQQDLLPKIGNPQGPVIINIEDAEEGNPQWSKEVNDTFNKHLDEITRLNHEGADFTYSSTIDMLRMDFFRKDMANWFIPFSWTHPEIDIKPDSKEMILTRGLMAANINICDIDRYATCLLYKQIENQLGNFPIANQLDELKQLGMIDLHEKRTPHDMARDQVRTFYRFFNHNPWEVENILPDAIKNLCSSHFFNLVVTSPKERLSLADKCLHIQLYEQAEYLYRQEKKADVQILQKLGYTLQKQKKYAEAVEVLQRSLLISDDEWTLHHIATCLRNSGRTEEALAYYDQLLEKQPDKQSYLQAKAKYLMDLNRFQDALQLFFKLDILFPNDTNVARGLAWCAFMVDKMEYAERYFEQNIRLKDATANDWMNYGHLLFTKHHRQEALNAYRHSWELSESPRQFVSAFENDTPILLGKGVPDEEIMLMEDIIHQSLRNKSQDRRQ